MPSFIQQKRGELATTDEAARTLLATLAAERQRRDELNRLAEEKALRERGLTEQERAAKATERETRRSNLAGEGLNLVRNNLEAQRLGMSEREYEDALELSRALGRLPDVMQERDPRVVSAAEGLEGPPRPGETPGYVPPITLKQMVEDPRLAEIRAAAQRSRDPERTTGQIIREISALQKTDAYRDQVGQGAGKAGREATKVEQAAVNQDNANVVKANDVAQKIATAATKSRSWQDLIDLGLSGGYGAQGERLSAYAAEAKAKGIRFTPSIVSGLIARARDEMLNGMESQVLKLEGTPGNLSDYARRNKYGLTFEMPKPERKGGPRAPGDGPPPPPKKKPSDVPEGSFEVQ